ncbi:hypothetical protein AB6A40_005456 [Gnathostoma spinigerum]|uniref:Gfo/Idh/MocA-like oxidoreductase N-terminal domain-containing protein n=1 Tax=Gnathostoma spinigerum TaxID=75299 RepID=A0ABD6EHQ2_9BILA
MENTEKVGLVCSNEDFIEFFIDIISNSPKFTLKALWCPDTERSIQLAADKDVPSVSHTAFQLISRTDTETIIIAAHPYQADIFCAQAIALHKNVICINASLLTIHHARLLSELSAKCNSSFVTIYALRHSPPFIALKKNLGLVGRVSFIDVTSSFIVASVNSERLRNDSVVTLHKQSHAIIDVLSFISDCVPCKISTTLREKSTIIDHFRLKQLETAVIQLSFGNIIANIRITCSDHRSLSLIVYGDESTFYFNENCLVCKNNESTTVIWQNANGIQKVYEDGLRYALSAPMLSSSLDELSILKCLS